MGGLCGNSIWGCARASLINSGRVLNFCLNSLGDVIWCVREFWIWLRVVMLYVCNLLRYILVVCCWFGEKRAYFVVCFHASSIADCFMRKFLMVVCTWISYSFLSR